jgi:hypothetical protein
MRRERNFVDEELMLSDVENADNINPQFDGHPARACMQLLL